MICRNKISLNTSKKQSFDKNLHQIGFTYSSKILIRDEKIYDLLQKFGVINGLFFWMRKLKRVNPRVNPFLPGEENQTPDK